MNIVLDIGNTNVKSAIFSNNKIIEYVSTDNFSLNFLKELILKYPSIENLCFSNTSSNFKNISILCKELKINCLETNHKCKLPISIDYKTPITLGSDRIALAVGASIQYPGNKLIIDLGTCITYDVVLGSRYIGGQISPGLEMRFFALNHYTGNLPKINFKSIENFIGKTTESSILIGVYDGLLYEINGILEKYKLRYPGIDVILTGGHVKIFKKKLRNINFINPYLLIHGLNYIIASND